MKSEDQTQTHLEVGIIARPHGVRGELKVRMHFEESDALHQADSVVLVPEKGAPQRYEVESVRGSAKGPILALREVPTIEVANTLRNAKVWVHRESVPQLEPGEYYLVDLVGCSVVLDGAVIGEVIRVRPDPSVDTMVLKLEGGEEAEVPIVDAWVGTVEISQKRVELLSEDGLIR